MNEKAALSLLDLRCRLGSSMALDGATLDVRWGSVTVLLGRSGSGKSTLLACLGGHLPLSSGRVWLGGRLLPLLTPATAREAGLHLLPQNPALAPGLDVASNIFLGKAPVRWRFFADRPRMVRDARALLERWRVALPVTGVPVGNLSRGQRQTVALLQALAAGARVLLLDEPLAFAGLRERARFGAMIDDVRQEGLAVLCASRSPEDALRYADDLAVLVQGRVVARLSSQGADPAELLKLMA